MKTIQSPCRLLLESLRFGQDFILYALIFVSAFFRNRASLGCELVAIRSQLTFYKENIRQKKQTRPRFTPAFRLLWVLLSEVWSGWKSAADLMQPKTVLKWHNRAFRLWASALGKSSPVMLGKSNPDQERCLQKGIGRTDATSSAP